MIRLYNTNGNTALTKFENWKFLKKFGLFG